MAKRVLLCSCEGSQHVDGQAIEEATGLSCGSVYNRLCTTQLPLAAEAMESGDVVIACGQEMARFEELAAELGVEMPGFVDIRDRAGWSDEGGRSAPKMAALLAEAMLERPDVRTQDVQSEGVCLVVGAGDAAFVVAETLATPLAVTVLVTDGTEPPLRRDFDVISGRLRNVTGALGGFEVTIDALRQTEPGGRGALGYGPPRDGGQSECDILIDLAGGTPFVTAPEKREGYLRADPRDPVAIGKLLAEAVQLVGTFEKPLYLRTEPMLCAHSRAGQVGCTRCLDVCPTGAISPDGDHVTIDPMICAGCGSCAALCPSGAIAYDDPPVSVIFRRIETLARTYRAAGGRSPRLLVADDVFGREMISLAARFGRGLPADVIPLNVSALAGFGHAEILAALACGFAAVDILPAPTTERDALDREVATARALAGDHPVRVLETTDPEALPEALYSAERVPDPVKPILPMGDRRQVARLAARALNPRRDVPVSLPDNAPYGAVLVNTEACTLCLSCVSLCPSGALLDNPDKPQLRFQEDACLQCGICATACPEDAIALLPRMDLTDAALTQRVMKEEEPFECIECGTPFGVRSTVERITEKLAGKHGMFANPQAARMIQMCDDCRVKAQFSMQGSPMGVGPRPPVRTTDDYYSDRKDH